MDGRKRFLLLSGLLAVLAIGAMALSTYIFYQAHFDQQRARLVELAKSQARLIEAVARFDEMHSDQDHLQGAAGATLSQIRDAHSNFEGFGETGEFILAERRDGQLYWLTQPRMSAETQTQSTPVDGLLAGPMDAALNGNSGSLIGLDYRGVDVLAAHEPVAVLNLGIVAKIDLAEIRSPFIRAGLVFSIINVLMILAAAYVSHLIRRPQVRHLESSLRLLKNSNDQLAGQIEESTAELQSELTMGKMVEGSLLQAKAEAETANQSKSAFLANMSHELRTPLNSIIGFSEILKEQIFGKLGNQKYKEYAADINHSGLHLLALINEILDVSKIEAGALEIADETFDPAEPLREGVRMVEQRARDAGLKLSCEISPNIPYLIADPLRVKQMVLNLLTNSIKFTPRGGQVRVCVFGQAGVGLEIEVTDTGVGIAEEHLKTVMEPFGQARKDPMVAPEEGTGLGLPLIKMLIELHGGSIKLTSTKGQGTQVVLRFPKERVLAQTAEAV